MDEQNGIVWRISLASGYTTFEASLAPYGTVGRVVPEDTSRPLLAEGNALAYFRKRGDDTFTLFLAKVDAYPAARMTHAALVKSYAI